MAEGRAEAAAMRTAAAMRHGTHLRRSRSKQTNRRNGEERPQRHGCHHQTVRTEAIIGISKGKYDRL